MPHNPSSRGDAHRILGSFEPRTLFRILHPNLRPRDPPHNTAMAAVPEGPLEVPRTLKQTHNGTNKGHRHHIPAHGFCV